MQQFLQSAFLQALTHSLIASVWQIGLLWFGAIALLRMFKFSSKQKFNIAFTAQVSGFILFVFTFINVYNAERLFAGTLSTPVFSGISIFINICMPYVALFYLLALCYKTIRFFIFYAETQHLKKQEISKIAVLHRIFVQEMSGLLSLKRKVHIYVSGKINCPLTIGFLKPVILIPLAAVNHLTAEQMEAVILHELAHIKRADYLLFILQSFIEKILFFNIFSKMLGNIIERERENACDDWVLQFRYNSMHYAEALFKLGRLKTQSNFAMATSGKKENFLLLRIKRLVNKTESRNTYSSFLFSLFFMMMIACLLVSFSAKPVTPKVSGEVKNNPQQNLQNKEIAFYENDLPVKASVIKQTKNISEEAGLSYTSLSLSKSTQKNNTNPVAQKAIEIVPVNKNYAANVQQIIDSINQNITTYTPAVNTQVMVTPDVLRKAMSYQNFKTIENMLAVTGDSVNIIESDVSKDSYRKEITIEATDKDGNRHIYQVIVELYQ